MPTRRCTLCPHSKCGAEYGKPGLGQEEKEEVEEDEDEEEQKDACMTYLHHSAGRRSCEACLFLFGHHCPIFVKGNK